VNCKKIVWFLSIAFSIASSIYAEAPSFKIMMGNRGTLNWRAYGQERLWNRNDVKISGGIAQKQYENSIVYLEKEPIYTVPKRIHFIWLGPAPFPKTSVVNILSWMKLHPSWDFYFWTDDPERALPVKKMTKRLVTEFDFGPLSPLIEEMENWGGKSDLMRCPILYQEGGIYVDHDVECIRSFDSLCCHFDFIAGYEPLHHYMPAPEDPFIVNNGLIITRPNHPILKKTIERACERWTEAGNVPGKFWKVVARTFDPFTYTSKAFLGEGNERNILMPTCYFQSYGGFNKATISTLKEMGYVYAIHHFEGYWKPRENRHRRLL
jgi:hypothetical protein